LKLASRSYLFVPLALALALPVGVATAQSTKTTDAAGSSNPAVNTSNTASKDRLVASSALEKGSNSFTEGEARRRLESAGVSAVTDLKKDESGIWRGKATRDGKSVSVGLDYKGVMSAE
jgi:hypothetical protein